MKRNDDSYEAGARILKAMANPSRLKMLDLLQAGERCVCDLRDEVGSDLSTVSRHLALLRSAGLVHSRREGTRIFYALRVPCVMKTLGCVEAVLREDARTSRKLVVGG